MSGVRITAAAVLAVVALAGCGGSPELKFQRNDLRPVQIQIERAKRSLSAQLQTVRLGNSNDARALRVQVRALETQVEALGRLTPPHGLDPAFRRYAKANRRLVHELESFATALGGRSSRTLERASARAQVAAAAIARTQSELNAEIAGHS